jgi:hypothetical protein
MLQCVGRQLVNQVSGRSNSPTSRVKSEGPRAKEPSCTPWAFKMGPTDHPGMSVSNYEPTFLNNHERQRPYTATET